MKWIVVMGSAAGHLAAVLGLDQLDPTPSMSAPTAITVVDTPAPPEPEKPPTPEPEPEPSEAPPARSEPAAPSPLARQVTPTAQAAAPAADALPDLGLELSGTASGGPGWAVASGSGGPGPARVASRRMLSAAPSPQPIDKADPCAVGPAPKPRLENFQKPAYSEAARAAGVTGKVRVSITVGADGSIERAAILQGLGHGLDEATLAAVRAASFSAAVHCGKAVRSTFTMSVRFSAE